MEDKLITFETAKLANEKEFNIFQDSGYEQNGTYFDNSRDYDGCKFGYCKEIYLAPTQSLLQRWLREKHNVDVLVYIVKLKNIYYTTIYNNQHYLTYEQALEERLLKALALI